jgi:hypothetical protein
MPSIGSMRTSLTTSATVRCLASNCSASFAAAGGDDRLPSQFEGIAHRLAQGGVVFNHQYRQPGPWAVPQTARCRRFDRQHDHEFRAFARHRTAL